MRGGQRWLAYANGVGKVMTEREALIICPEYVSTQLFEEKRVSSKARERRPGVPC